MNTIRQRVANFCRDESGASAAEYALILAILTTGIAGATITLGNVISTSIEDSGDCIKSIGRDCGPDEAAAGDGGGSTGGDTGGDTGGT